jgi:predicted TIM-barrel fold metal-dependent hydrolase
MTEGYVDAWVNTPVLAEDKLVQPDELSSNVVKWFHTAGEAGAKGNSLDDLIGFMDDAGVAKTIMSARASWDHPDTRPSGPFQQTAGMPDGIFDLFLTEMADAASRFSGRIYGSVLIDPWGAMRAVRQLERAVKDYGMIAARLFPAGNGIAPNHPLCYPIYAKCVELGVPITVNLGVPGPLRLAANQRPILLDEVLLAFPELTIVGTHIGHPWHLETVALLQKYPNFRLMTSGWAPRYVPQEIIHHLNTRGSHQVMWASDFPLLSVERAVREAEQLPFKSETVKNRYLRDNCLEAFRLPLSGRSESTPAARDAPLSSKE